jgi:PST family polysaccharide transporter
MLGPLGVGTLALYQAIIALAGILAGLGINQSGVRQIAEAVSIGEEKRISLAAFVLKHFSFISGGLGMLFLMLFSWPISKLSFGNSRHGPDILIISVALFFNTMSAGQLALLQGLRRLRDLAASQLFGAIIGAVASIGVVWLLREQGITLYIVSASACSALVSWWYARQVRISPHLWGREDIVQEGRHLLGMGVAFMVSGLANAGAIYLMRIIISKSLGGFALGLYSAATSLSVVYVDMLFTAMAADYYPRLTAVADDNVRLNRMVNEQTEMGLLIAISGVLATLVLAPFVLSIFYSSQFRPATGIIRWQDIGVVFRLTSFPLGYIQPAKGLKKIYMVGEISFALLSVLVLFMCIGMWGYEGMGIAFAIVYFLHILFGFSVCYVLTGFRWEKRVLWTMLSSLTLAILVILLVRNLPGKIGEFIGLALALVALVLSVRRLNALTDFDLQNKFFSLLRRRRT